MNFVKLPSGKTINLDKVTMVNANDEDGVGKYIQTVHFDNGITYTISLSDYRVLSLAIAKQGKTSE